MQVSHNRRIGTMPWIVLLITLLVIPDPPTALILRVPEHNRARERGL